MPVSLVDANCRPSLQFFGRQLRKLQGNRTLGIGIRNVSLATPLPNQAVLSHALISAPAAVPSLSSHFHCHPYRSTYLGFHLVNLGIQRSMSFKITSYGLSALVALTSLLMTVRADDMSGMDMSGDDDSMSMMYFHFTLGDVLWFKSWEPTNGGAMFGACLGLFLLAIVERWVHAYRSILDANWRKRAQTLLADKLNTVSSSSPARKAASARTQSRTTPPFVPAIDISRGLLYGLQAFVGYLLMLTIMTYQAAFIFSILIGLAVGETAFGRYSSGSSH